MQLLRQRVRAVPAYSTIEERTLSWGGAYCRPPNKPLELTPLRVDLAWRDCESWILPKRVPDSTGRRSSTAGRWADRGITIRLQGSGAILGEMVAWQDGQFRKV